MLLIVIAIVVPGYFLINRISRTFYSGNTKWDAKTENQYGFDRLEKQRDEETKGNDAIIQDEESTDRDETEFPNEANINENETQTFKKDPET